MSIYGICEQCIDCLLYTSLRRLFPNLSVVDEENRKLSDREITRRGGIEKVAKGICSRRLGLDNAVSYTHLYMSFTNARRYYLSPEIVKRFDFVEASFQRKSEQFSGTKSRISYGKIVSGQTVTLLRLQEEQTLKR